MEGYRFLFDLLVNNNITEADNRYTSTFASIPHTPHYGVQHSRSFTLTATIKYSIFRHNEPVHLHSLYYILTYLLTYSMEQSPS